MYRSKYHPATLKHYYDQLMLRLFQVPADAQQQRQGVAPFQVSLAQLQIREVKEKQLYSHQSNMHIHRNKILTECFLEKSSFRISLHALRESFSLSFGFPPLGGGCKNETY
jgi:hypothetical protein